jgi:hypothetical protein
LLTGRIPHAGSDGRPDITAKLSGTPPEPPSKEITKTPRPVVGLHDTGKVSIPDLDLVVLTALNRDPLQRYGTVQLFGEDLRRCLDGRPIVARPSSVTYTARKAIARNPVVWAVAAAALVVALTGAWMAVSAQFERVQLQAKEEQLAKFVDMLSAKVAEWPAGTAATEKVADMRAATELMASDTVRTLAERAPDPLRVKQLFNSLRGTLERADAASRDEPAIRKEVALAFRGIGDVESSAPLPQLADKTEAARSYRRAAVIAADLRGADGSWASQQINELSGLLTGLGTPLDAEIAQSTKVVDPPPPPQEPPPVRERPGSSAREAAQTAAVASDLPEVDPAARADVEQRLRSAVLDAERARRNFEALRNTLASQGQTVRGDVESMLSQADGLIEDARGLLEENDLVNAEEYLRRASYQLKRVFQAVGG